MQIQWQKESAKRGNSYANTMAERIRKTWELLCKYNAERIHGNVGTPMQIL
ncbi:hypothetical protein JWG44_22000 [Leptospira sp. 201903071]|uniref:hypothetical protein n=1 Tax=Leptospira ainazelensis TaxID=2810034 RepID=UPI001962E30A|nr:hypothetical protein [Leptospira ainazelensis]MBM9502929.1 hypothetical protein [Leptospira ainazelensis]